MYKELFSCKDMVSVVTGGCGLIGQRVVRGLLDFGSRVYVADRDLEAFDALRESGAEFVELDITSEASVKKVIDYITEKEKRLDILVNTAYPRTPDWGEKIENVNFSSWKTNVNDHLGGYFLTSTHAAETMKALGCGVIINFSSIYGIVGPDFSIYDGTDMTMPVAYAAIKGGIITFTKYLATYYGEYGIRANVISPGGIFNDQPPRFVESYSKKTPLRRMGRPDDLVGAVLFLSSRAGSYITGQNIIVDGGWTAW
jgi:NAD(P)-dependent dehydrogenase (short-subunit alcohol dehydrogenase family)